MPCFTCCKACERDLFVSSIPWLSTKTIVVSSNNIHTVTLFQAIFSIDSLFDNVRHIFKTLNDVTPLWKRSKDANAPASQLKPSDSPPPHPPAGMTGAFTFYASKSRWILCSPGPTEWKAFDLLYKMRYILWVVALLGACDVTNNGRHLGFYQELEIRLKPREMVIFCAWDEK